eukprot:1191546-Prorocentrum_minimum.AAC.1
MALTATATPAVCKDIETQLRLKECAFFRQSFNRPNLSYEVSNHEGRGGTLRSSCTRPAVPGLSPGLETRGEPTPKRSYIPSFRDIRSAYSIRDAPIRPGAQEGQEDPGGDRGVHPGAAHGRDGHHLLQLHERVRAGGRVPVRPGRANERRGVPREAQPAAAQRRAAPLEQRPHRHRVRDGGVRHGYKP